MNSKKLYAIVMDADLHLRLKIHAAHKDTSMSKITVKLLREYLDKSENKYDR